MIYVVISPVSVNENYYFEIENGDNINTVATNLYDKKIIKSKFLFKIIIKERLGENTLAYGKYNIKKFKLGEERINMLGIIDILVNKKNYTPGISLTIPEGFTLEEISSRVSKVFNISYQDFYRVAKNYNGKLYPETYYFPQNVKAEEILHKMLLEFDKEYPSIKKEELILASIVEGEGRDFEDMQIISGILQERMHINMPLQVDVARITYTTKDLPRDPINNPGKNAIEATLHPKKTNYLYYITGSDGKFYYAKTYEEHKINIRKYLK